MIFMTSLFEIYEPENRIKMKQAEDGEQSSEQLEQILIILIKLTAQLFVFISICATNNQLQLIF